MKDQAEPSQELGRRHHLPSRLSPGTLQALARGRGGRGSDIRICEAGLTPFCGLPSLSLSCVCERAEQGHSGQLQDRAS